MTSGWVSEPGGWRDSGHWGQEQEWPLPLPSVPSSVSICVSLSPTCLSCAEPICSFPSSIGSQNLPREESRRVWEEKGSQAEGYGQNLFLRWLGDHCPAALHCSHTLSGFCPSSAQHRGRRLLGGDCEGAHRLVPS